MTRLRVLSCLSVVVAIVVAIFNRATPTTIRHGKGVLLPKHWLTNAVSPITPPEHIRPPDQTFLTYPEWFLVYGPAEQADFFQRETSTKFPFMAHVYQLWESYAVIYDQIRDNFAFNTRYHVMIMVIAVSSTVEFVLKGAYETVVGRLTGTQGPLTDEDRFNATFARDYVTFIATAPWYEFDFKSRLAQLWSQTSLLGRYPLRKWERRYILTTELAVKTVYGWLIGLGTRTAYERPIPKTAVVVESIPNGPALLTLPRYAPFKTNAYALALTGAQFKEVAGNQSAILITILAPQHWQLDSENFRSLFTQPLPTKPGVKRVAIATPIPLLHKTLQQLTVENLQIEHIYDF